MPIPAQGICGVAGRDPQRSASRRASNVSIWFARISISAKDPAAGAEERGRRPGGGQPRSGDGRRAVAGQGRGARPENGSAALGLGTTDTGRDRIRASDRTIATITSANESFIVDPSAVMNPSWTAPRSAVC